MRRTERQFVRLGPLGYEREVIRTSCQNFAMSISPSAPKLAFKLPTDDWDADLDPRVCHVLQSYYLTTISVAVVRTVSQDNPRRVATQTPPCADPRRDRTFPARKEVRRQEIDQERHVLRCPGYMNVANPRTCQLQPPIFSRARRPERDVSGRQRSLWMAYMSILRMPTITSE